MSVEYKVAVNPGDYARAHRLMKEYGGSKQKLTFPTILAVKDGEVVGLIGTRIYKDMIVAGPVVVRRTMGALGAIRLVEAYENAMRNMGIEWFIFWTDGEQSIIEKAIRRFNPEMTPYSIKGSKRFYRRLLVDRSADTIH